MDARGQVSIELVLLIGFIMVLMMGITSYLGEDIDLNQAMSAARSGAIEGANVNSFAIYPGGSDEAFNKYYRDHPELLNPHNVKIIRIEYRNRGSIVKHDKTWTWIQLRVVASAPTLKRDVHDATGDRINFYVRKAITESFGTPHLTNIAYNPAYSNSHYFTTLGVRWV